MRRMIFVAGIASALGGCLGASEPMPADTYYRIAVRAPERAVPSPVFPGTLSVEAFDGDGLVRERPLLYSDASQVYGIRQHNFHFWMDPPTRLVQGQLVSFLRETGLAGTIVTPELRVRSDYELIGRIRRLERVLTDQTASVVAEIELSLVRAEDRALLFADTYTAEVATKDDSVPAAIEAMNNALTFIFESFASDAGGALQTASE